MTNNTDPVLVTLTERLTHHIREYSLTVATQLTDSVYPTGWRNHQCGRNRVVDFANAEYHHTTVGELAAEWLELTGERYPLGFWFESRSGRFSKHSEKICDAPMAKSVDAPQ